MEFKNKIFVSHSDKDKEIVQRITNSLHDYPFLEIFVAPEDIKAGKFWIDELKFNVKTCDTLLVILTKNYHSANWTEQEVGLAWAYGKRIVAINLDENMGNGYVKSFQINKFPVEFNSYHVSKLAIDLYTEIDDKEEFVEGLLKYGLIVSNSFNQSHAIASLCSQLVKNITSENASHLINAYKKNSQVNHAIKWDRLIERSLIQRDPYIQFSLEQRKDILSFIRETFPEQYERIQKEIDESKKQNQT